MKLVLNAPLVVLRISDRNGSWDSVGQYLIGLVVANRMADGSKSSPSEANLELSDQWFDLARKGDEMAMTAVIGKQDIVSIELTSNSHRTKLLTNAGMHCSIEFPLRKQFEKTLFHLTNQQCLTNDFWIKVDVESRSQSWKNGLGGYG